MMSTWPGEIAGVIPGIKPVMQWLPCDQEVTTETVTVPASTEYAITADKTFQTGKTYYELSSNSDGTTSYVAATVTAGDTIPDEHYFEQYAVAASTIASTVTYERYSNGMYPVEFKGNIVKKVEHPSEIRKTVISEKTVGSTKVTTIARYHAIALWANRATANYVPLCEMMEQNKVGASARVF